MGGGENEARASLARFAFFSPSPHHISLSLQARLRHGPTTLRSRASSVPRLRATREKKNNKTRGSGEAAPTLPARPEGRTPLVRTQPHRQPQQPGRARHRGPPAAERLHRAGHEQRRGEAPPPRPPHFPGALCRVRVRTATASRPPRPTAGRRHARPATRVPGLGPRKGDDFATTHGGGGGAGSGAPPPRPSGGSRHRAPRAATGQSRGEAARPTERPPQPFRHGTHAGQQVGRSGERGAATSANRAVLGALGKGRGKPRRPSPNDSEPRPRTPFPHGPPAAAPDGPAGKTHPAERAPA